uniref:Sad1 and UNC84 domain containing 1 n=1 Tax=Crocodylus porosus TaxID=8502 RepID=A0A7M4FIX2_CROPO
MDFSRLHTYTPPQYFSLLTEHKLDPVFDSPRMSRRSLRLITAGYSKADDVRTDGIYNNSYSGNMSFTEQSSNSAFSQSSFNSHVSDTSTLSTVLDESLIREQTELDHFWGLDDDGDPKGGDATVIQGNGDLATVETQTTVINGYTCNDCSMLSERKEVLTAYSTSHMPSSRIYSRDRSQKHKSGGTFFYMNKILQLVKYAATSFASLLVQLFQMVLLKLGYEFKAHSNYCGSMNVKEFLREDGHLGINGESLCDDCKGKKHLETYTTVHMQSSRSKRVARTIWHTFSYAGYFVLRVLRTVGTTGWLVSRKVLALLWLAIVSPGKAASGAFWWLGTGWYQLVTLISLFNVFLLTRCLPKIYKLLLFLIPLLLLLGIRMKELEKQIALMSDRCHHHDEEYGKVMLLLQKLQDQVALMNDKSEMLTLIKNVMGQHLKETKSEETAHSVFQNLLSKAKQMEQELASMRVELLNLQGLKTQYSIIDGFHQVDTQIKESVKLILFGDRHSDLPESLLQWLMSKFVTKNDLQTLLQDLEMRILKNISFHMSVSNQKATSEIVTSAVNAGISGISEAQARIIVNNALKLYSQDKTGMVDFALESGGGSILSTRCSETYETKTALISLFGIPLWYFSQSPRVVIQPEMYPGNCWAFKGSQGYLVVRLSIKIYPTAFTLEHIPKTLSPTGNITSAPKDFSVYGLDDEYQEEGVLLGQYRYDEGGEPLQTFQVMEKNENAFQIVELRILSNWGHTEYTCLYRFRVHGRPAE